MAEEPASGSPEPNETAPPTLPAIDPTGMTPEQLSMVLQNHTQYLEEKCNGLKQQLHDLKTQVYSDNDSVIQRIERILALMTSQMSLIKQMVELVDNFGDRLTSQEQFKMKHELEYIGIVERQNRFAKSLQNMAQNSHEIFIELEEIKDHVNEHDKFQWKLTISVSVGAAVIAWLLTGDNFAKLLRLCGWSS